MRLGLTPDVFWALSAAEWGALCAVLAGAAPRPMTRPMTREDLGKLMRTA